MFCPKCGSSNDDASKFCSGCGSLLGENTSDSAESSSSINVVRSSDYSDSIKAMPIFSETSNSSNSDGSDVPRGLNTASLVMGILTIVGCFASFIFGLLAVIFGAIGLSKPSKNRGFGIAGIVLGIVGIILWVIIAIVYVKAVMDILGDEGYWDNVARILA